MAKTQVGRVREDRGITLVFTAMVLVVLMIFAAFAVDLGQLAIARRDDQGAVDTAAMAGAISAAQGENNPTIKTKVIEIAEANLGVASGVLDWNSCAGYVDPGTGWSAIGGSNCIMRSGDRLMVRTPKQQIKSTFGAVIGRSSYSHRAFAVAGPQLMGYGSVLPFGVFSSGAGHICLRTDNPSSPVSPCAGSSTGDSGILNLGLYGNPAVGTPNDCVGNGNGANGRAANNVATGADHRLGSHPTPDTSNLDNGSKCGAGDLQPPYSYAADTVTGAGATNAVTSGLVAGSEFYDGGPARLQRPSMTSLSPATVSVEGHNLDNTPLWVFIGDGLTGVPGACQRQQFEDALLPGFGTTPNTNSIPDVVENHLKGFGKELRMEKMLERCFALYTLGSWDDGGSFKTSDVPPGPGEVVTTTECSAVPSGTLSKTNPRCTGVVFNRNTVTESPEIWDIQLVPRFAYVPTIHPSFALGANAVSWTGMQAVYLQRLCMGNQQCNQGTFSPGPGLWNDLKPGNTNDSVAALSAWAFADHMLPGKLGGSDAPYDINTNVFLRLLR